MAAAASMLAAVLLCAVAAAFFSGADAKKIAAGGDLVAKTCADMTSHDWGFSFDDEKFCKSRLRMDKKRSAAAKHPRDLVLIAMDLAQRAVADVDSKVDAVLRSGDHRSNDAELVLRHCRLDYAAVASTIPVCRAMVEDYTKQQQLAPSDYLECARRLRIDATRCWFRVAMDDGLFNKLVFRKEIQEAWMRIELVDGMLEEMLGVVIDDHNPPL